MTLFELIVALAEGIFEFILLTVYLLGYLLIPGDLMVLAIRLNSNFSNDDNDKNENIWIIKIHLIIFGILLVICSLAVLIETRSIHEFLEYLFYLFLFTVLFFLPLTVFICLIQNIVGFIKASRKDSKISKKRLLIPFMISLTMIPACAALIIVFGSELTFM